MLPTGYTRSLSENGEPTAEKPFRPDSPIKFVKYAQYSPHLIGESDSKWLPLATASIFGQAPNKSHSTLMICAGFSLLVHVALLFSNPSGQSQTIISKQTPGGFLVRLIKVPDNPKQLKQNKQRQQSPIEKAHVQTPLPPQLTHNKKSLLQQDVLNNALPETEMRAKVIANLTHQFQQFFFYPRLARQHNWQGQVTLGFSINDNGFIQNIRVATSSGYNVLDEAAITAMNRIPKLNRDANLPKQGMDMELPILYQLTKG